MKRFLAIITLFGALLMGGLVASCDGFGTKAGQAADSLHVQAHRAFLQMDYRRADSLIGQVYVCTKNELQLLRADVERMWVCQRTARYKAFYDARYSAQRRMRRIEEDSDLFQGEEAIELRKLRLAFQQLSSQVEQCWDAYSLHGETFYNNPADRYEQLMKAITHAESLNYAARYTEAIDSLRLMLMRIDTIAVPECKARICEQLSLAYAGLGDKPTSDRYRNIYLDILDETRQDREWESRAEALYRESRLLTDLIFIVGIGIVLVCVLFFLFNRAWQVRSRRQMERLRSRMDDSRAAWREENNRMAYGLNKQLHQIESDRYMSEQHIARKKRENIEKKACLALVNGIQPYLDRMLREVHKLNDCPDINEEIRKERYRYIGELADTISEQNDILAHWIKMKQGTLSLHIETFELTPLFDLLRKGGRAFELRNQQFDVAAPPCEAIVKADKALTLFMMNTLADNARKYTPEGGQIKVEARCETDYVEIAVSDNGPGLSDEEVRHISRDKVYKPGQGHGFGLMNCRGIIEKYRKTSPLFAVCDFGVESKPGKGSRFWFRLPMGVKRALLMAGIWLASIGSIVAVETASVSKKLIVAEPNYMLQLASDYADEAYFCNVDGEYELALAYIDSAITILNRHYHHYGARPSYYMRLSGNIRPAELYWWDELFDTDYHVILDIRNEAAVASLALRRWDVYRYNNDAYTTLYQLLGKDQSLEEYCKRLERSTGNKTVAIWLSVFLLCALPVGFYFLYLRKRLLMRWNLEQVLEVNRRVYAAPSGRLLQEAFDALNELLNSSRVGLLIYNKETGEQTYVCYPDALSEEKISETDNMDDETVHDGLSRCIVVCFRRERYQEFAEYQAFPLWIESEEGPCCVGAVGLQRVPGSLCPDDVFWLEMVARDVALVVHKAVVEVENKHLDIEEASDEALRAAFEDNLLHVQNQVLDNCLSTIKHETAYYPSKIKQLVVADAEHNLRSITELAEYYKGIFSILLSCASRQLQEVTFRRIRIRVDKLLADAEHYALRKDKKQVCRWKFVNEVPGDVCLRGDIYLLRYLFEVLIDEILQADVEAGGDIRITATVVPDFVRFCVTDTRRSKSDAELHKLFYPELARMKGGANRSELSGIAFLLCKQIVREHDEFCGRRGCRIYAESAEGGGFSVVLYINKVD